MAQTKKEIRAAYNAKTYRQFNLRVRKDSELCACMEQTMQSEGESLNHIVVKLLSKHYGISMPEPADSKNKK